MDLTTLSDEELDALQLAVNVEIGARLQKRRVGGRLTRVIAEATDHGLPSTVIETAIDDAYIASTGKKRPIHQRSSGLVSEKTSPSPAQSRRNKGAWRNTIEQSTPQSP
jgi:hypothetical protein